MSWIAITDLVSPAFNISGIGVAKDATCARPPAEPDEILPTGTLMIELRSGAEPGRPQKILTYRRNRDWVRAMAVELDAEGRLTLSFRQGAARSQVKLKLPVPPHDSRLRISYAWDAPDRSGRLTVELLDQGQLFQTLVHDPVPLPVADVRVLIRNGGAANISPAVDYIAVSDEVEPVGFGTGITTGTWVETPQGPVPVEQLRLGDEVITATSGIRPVRWIGRRSVPAMGSFRPVRLRAPFFGLERDMRLAPEHRIRLDFAEAEYMLGEDEVLLAATHLVNGKQARHEDKPRLVTYHQILLDVHDCLLHHGLWAESLFVGMVRRRPDIAQSTVLAAMPISALPEHRAFSRHRLSDFESRSLAATLRA